MSFDHHTNNCLLADISSRLCSGQAKAQRRQSHFIRSTLLISAERATEIPTMIHCSHPSHARHCTSRTHTIHDQSKVHSGPTHYARPIIRTGPKADPPGKSNSWYRSSNHPLQPICGSLQDIFTGPRDYRGAVRNPRLPRLRHLVPWAGTERGTACVL